MDKITFKTQKIFLGVELAPPVFSGALNEPTTKNRKIIVQFDRSWTLIASTSQ